MIAYISLSAVAPSDYAYVHTPVIFLSCQIEICIPVDINDDETVEEVESFYLTLEDSFILANYMVLEPHKTKITIADNDSKLTL